MNRRQILKTALVAAGSNLVPAVSFAGEAASRSTQSAGDVMYVNPVSGQDAAAGTKDAPLRSLSEVAKRVNASTGTGGITAILSEGIYAVGETALLKPANRSFTRANRLTIRAEVLPDDPQWHIGRMPTLIHTLPVPPTWNGRPDPLGGAADGMLIETSHVSIQGLRILGMPVIESPVPGQVRRLYAISRLPRDLDDLEISQCCFASDEIVAPNHVAIIANGNGVVVDHCIFRGQKISVVFWTPGSTGHAMRNCVCHGLYGSAVWTSGIADDFDYRNNVVDSSNYVWTHQAGASALADAGGRAGQQAASAPPKQSHYNVINSLFTNNKKLTGSGTGARLGYQDIDSSFLELVRTRISDQPVVFERDQTKRDYLHPIAGSEAAKIGAGLFVRPNT